MWVAEGKDAQTLNEYMVFPGYDSFVLFACPIINEGKQASHSTVRKQKAKENNDQLLSQPCTLLQESSPISSSFRYIEQNRITILQLEINSALK